MLKEILPQTKTFVLNSGLEIIARVIEDNGDHWMIERPYQVVGIDEKTGQVRFAYCFILLSTDSPIPIYKTGIVTQGASVDAIRKQYENIIGAVYVPEKPSIII